MARIDRRLTALALSLLAICWLASTEALAEDDMRAAAPTDATAVGPSAAKARPFPPASVFEVGFSYQFDAGVEDGGDFDLWDVFASGTYDVGMTERFAIVTIFDYRADIYGFDDVPPTGPDPLLDWGLIHTPRFQPLMAFDLGERWRLYVGPTFEFSFEGGANIRDAFRPGGLAAAEWTISDDLRVGLGVLAVDALDSGAYVQPVLLLDWELADSLALHMASWTTRGGEIELDWRIHEQFELAASVGYRREQYRLNERTDGAIPPALPTPTAISEGLAEDRAYTTALRASWMPRCRFVQNVFGDLRIDLDVAVALAGRLEVRDENDALLTEQSYDAAPSLGLTFRVPL